MKLTSDYSSYDDERLMRVIAQQQEEALAELYNRYNRLVFSLALGVVNDRATAEEITLDVFMRVWQKADTYRADQAKVSTWLTHITRNHSIDILRRRSVRPDQYALHWEDAAYKTESAGQDPQDSIDVTLQRERVHAALARLPVDQRQALLLAFFNGYSHSQIAEVLRQPLGTIKTRLRLAMQKLREYLGQEEEKSIEPYSTYSRREEE